MSTTRVRATPAKKVRGPVDITDLTTPDGVTGLWISPGDGGQPETVPVSQFAASTNASTIPFLVEKYKTAGAGTSASPWTGWNSDLATAVAAGRPIIWNDAYYGTATPLVFTDQRVSFYAFGKRPTIRYTGSTAVEAVLKIFSNGVPINGDNIFENHCVEGLFLDGGGHAQYGLSLVVAHSSVFRRLYIGNTTDGLVKTDDAGCNLFDRVISHKDMWTTMPTNGFLIKGSFHSQYIACNAGSRNTPVAGRAFDEQPATNGSTVSFSNTYINCTGTNQVTGFYQEATCRNATLIGGGYEGCTNTHELYGKQNRVIASDNSDSGGAIIGGAENVLEAGYYPFTITISGDSAEFNNVRFTGYTLSGNGTVKFRPWPAAGDSGNVFEQFDSGAGSLYVGVAKTNQFWSGQAGSACVVADAGKHAYIGTLSATNVTGCLGIGDNGIDSLPIASTYQPSFPKGIAFGQGFGTKILFADATVDFGTIAAGGYSDRTVTLTGVDFGNTDMVFCTPAHDIADIAGINFSQPWPSANNTVKIRCFNHDSVGHAVNGYLRVVALHLL
jgi:hypothetical protein